MTPVPFPQSLWDGFWLLFRVLTTFAFIAVMAWGLVVVRTMLTQIQSDRLERDTMLADLKTTAERLAAETALVVEQAEHRSSMLSAQMEENTELTRAAAAAAKDAYHEANNVNQKIAQIRPVDHLEAEQSMADSLTQIDKNTATIAQNTKKGKER